MSTTTHQLPSYQPSGAFGFRAVLVSLFVGAPLSAVMGHALAWAHAHAVGFIASTICVLLATLVFSITYSFLAGWTRSRHVAASTGVAIVWLVCLLAVRWKATLGETEALFLADAPWATISNWMGPMLGAVAEALAIGFFSIYMVRNEAAKPFSECCQQWSQTRLKGELWCDGASAQQVHESLQAQGIAYLLGLPRAEQFAAAPMASVWRTVCVQADWVEADARARWLTVSVPTHERNAEGKIKSNDEKVIAHWCVSAEEHDAVCTHLGVSERASQEVEEQAHDTGKDESTAGSTPLVLQPALSAMQANQFAACLQLAQAHCQHPDSAVQADAWRMCALALSRMYRWSEAFEHYHHLFELESSALNALQLATTSVMAGELTRGEAWFDQACEINRQTSAMPSARMRTAYLGALEQAGEFEAAVPHLDWLAKGYMAMRITDDTFVRMRGFPFFSDYLSKSFALLRHALPEEDLKAWYVNMGCDLDEDGQAMLAQHLAGLSA